VRGLLIYCADYIASLPKNGSPLPEWHATIHEWHGKTLIWLRIPKPSAGL